MWDMTQKKQKNVGYLIHMQKSTKMNYKQNKKPKANKRA